MASLTDFYSAGDEPVLKADKGKVRMDLLLAGMPETIREIAQVLTFGASKYSADSWRGVEKERYVAALYRHLNAYHMGEDLDEESGLPHLAHAITNLLFINELEK